MKSTRESSGQESATLAVAQPKTCAAGGTEDVSTTVQKSCKHEWDVLKGGRVHGKTGKGKYQCYVCQKCRAFQRRAMKPSK